ncbi:TauD/TfdA family dioxygenase [Streptomyces sp. HU2014]|uniref:TauD/TfdA family dioxygenase n=1 Tax=Streptomyces sp. HU2014 TaxID=2939414 RepID=UPI002010B18E|nr:TauD/TfdA family dioxygenase [Streptomyces sp. HU2014]UQI45904.1 TauD/TfdA family dioxygenase [Streptomyces sp. HU2014]
MSTVRAGAPAAVNGRRRSTRLFESLLVNVWGEDAAGVIADRLWRVGLVTVSGLTTAEAVADFAARVMDTSAYDEGGLFGLHGIRDTRQHTHRVDGAVLTRGPVDLHTCGAALPEPPRLVLVVCFRKASRGGETLLADGRAVFDDLLREQPDAAHALSLPGAASFGRGADAFAAPVFQILAGKRRVVRLRQDGLIRWPEHTQPYVPALRARLARHQRVIKLRPGEGYLLDNSRWLHGRGPFAGNRIFHRAEGSPLIPMDSDAWPEGDAW